MMTAYYSKKNKLLCFKQIPQGWNECSRHQIILLAAIQNSGQELGICSLAALRVLLRFGMIRFLLLSADIKIRLLSHVSFVFGENNLTQQKIPSYRRLYGPKDKLVNMVMKEFHACEMHYRMLRDNVPMATEKLIAVLYRPSKQGYNKSLDKDGDLREPYNGNTVPYRARNIQRWPMSVKLAIILFYDGCRQFIIKQHPAIFQQGGGSADEQFQGMFMMIRGIASDGKYGTFESVENMPVYTALNEVTLMIKEMEEFKRRNNINS